MKNILKNLRQRIVPPRHQQILYNQIIDEQQPGTILQDFGVLLEFVREHAPLNVTCTNHLLPIIREFPPLAHCPFLLLLSGNFHFFLDGSDVIFHNAQCPVYSVHLVIFLIGQIITINISEGKLYGKKEKTPIWRSAADV
jgi:hypothetical protein